MHSGVLIGGQVRRGSTQRSMFAFRLRNPSMA